MITAVDGEQRELSDRRRERDITRLERPTANQSVRQRPHDTVVAFPRIDVDDQTIPGREHGGRLGVVRDGERTRTRRRGTRTGPRPLHEVLPRRWCRNQEDRRILQQTGRASRPAVDARGGEGELRDGSGSLFLDRQVDETEPCDRRRRTGHRDRTSRVDGSVRAVATPAEKTLAKLGQRVESASCRAVESAIRVLHGRDRKKGALPADDSRLFSHINNAQSAHYDIEPGRGELLPPRNEVARLSDEVTLDRYSVREQKRQTGARRRRRLHHPIGKGVTRPRAFRWPWRIRETNRERVVLRRRLRAVEDALAAIRIERSLDSRRRPRRATDSGSHREGQFRPVGEPNGDHSQLRDGVGRRVAARHIADRLSLQWVARLRTSAEDAGVGPDVGSDIDDAACRVVDLDGVAHNSIDRGRRELVDVRLIVVRRDDRARVGGGRHWIRAREGNRRGQYSDQNQQLLHGRLPRRAGRST